MFLEEKTILEGDKIGTMVEEVNLDSIEDELEKLCTQMINILKGHREKGLIGESEYKEYIKHKEKFLAYLNQKRQQNSYNLI